MGSPVDQVRSLRSLMTQVMPPSVVVHYRGYTLVYLNYSPFRK